MRGDSAAVFRAKANAIPIAQKAMSWVTRSGCFIMVFEWRIAESHPARKKISGGARANCRICLNHSVRYVGDVKRDEARGVEVGFQRRNRESTSDAPGMGFGETRLSRALKAATDLPGFFLRA